MLKYIILLPIAILIFVKRNKVGNFIKTTAIKIYNTPKRILFTQRFHRKKHESLYYCFKYTPALSWRKQKRDLIYFLGHIPCRAELKVMADSISTNKEEWAKKYDSIPDRFYFKTNVAKTVWDTLYPKPVKSTPTTNPVRTVPKTFDLENELSQIIGLESVKDYVRGLSNNLRIQVERREKGLKTGKSQTMHMIFTGNPGTGKTTMARVIANVLHGCGVIPTNKLIETDRSGLVGQYIGETAQKTKEVVTSALGGILFIDEAYSLAQGGDKDFGKEAIDTLVKMMEDNRDNLVVILAGYTEDMEDFLDKNAGLKSRFPNIIEFPDYTNDELLQITKKLCFEQDYILDEGAEDALIDAFNDARTGKNFGNGREARNILEKAIRNQGTRLSNTHNEHSTSDLMTITTDDIA